MSKLNPVLCEAVVAHKKQLTLNEFICKMISTVRCLWQCDTRLMYVGLIDVW